MDRTEVYQEVERFFGIVPEWVKSLPETAIGELWELIKKVEISDSTAIPPKYKELIGLAVAATLRCRYCIYFHTEAARANGATEDETKEAVLMGSLTNLFSTYLNGSQYDIEQFKRETDEMVEHAREKVPADLSHLWFGM